MAGIHDASHKKLGKLHRFARPTANAGDATRAVSIIRFIRCPRFGYSCVMSVECAHDRSERNAALLAPVVKNRIRSE
jgi:hypothetical protein